MTDWAAWKYDQELVAHYTIRIRSAFRAALDESSHLITLWWSGTLAVTRQGLIDLISEHIEQKVAKVLHTLWEEAWYLGSRSADIAIHNSHPEFDGWKPGESATARVADEAGLRHLLHAIGPSMARTIASTRMEKLSQGLAEAVAGKSPKKLVSRLEDILRVKSRAPMIAETEVSRALNAAAMDHYRGAGIPMKQWITDDGNVCPVCVANAAQGPIPFSSPFQSGSMSSPQHPRCRCGVIPAKTVHKGNRPRDLGSDYHMEPGPRFPATRSQPQNPGGGGWGGGAPSQGRQAGDGNGSQVSNAYGAQERYQTSDTQRPGTAPYSDNAGGEPPRLVTQEVDRWEPGASRQVDENGQIHWYVTRLVSTSEFPHPSRGGDSGFFSDGSQVTHGNLSLDSPDDGRNSMIGNRGVGPSGGSGPPGGADSGAPDFGMQPSGSMPGGGRRGRAPNAIGKDATLDKEQARYRKAEDSRKCGNCVMFHGSTCDMVKGIISKNFTCDYWQHLIEKEEVIKGKNRPKAAGLVVLAKDTERVLMIQRDYEDPEDKNAGKWEWPGGRLEDDEAPLQAACREWSEEVGVKLPDGTIIGNWLSPDGKYEGFVLQIESEEEVPIFDKRKKDPDGGEMESIAWFEPDKIKDNPAVRSQIRDTWALISIALKGIKYARPLITKVGPEGFIHGYICVRPPCGIPGVDCDSPPCPATPQGAAFDTHFGHVYHQGQKIGRVKAAKNASGNYTAIHSGNLLGEGRQVVNTHATTRTASAADLVYYHNMRALSHEAMNVGNHEAQMALDSAASSFAGGNKELANAYLRDATGNASANGDTNLEAHLRTFRSHMLQNQREGASKAIKVFARKPGQQTKDIFPVVIPGEGKQPPDAHSILGKANLSPSQQRILSGYVEHGNVALNRQLRQEGNVSPQALEDMAGGSTGQAELNMQAKKLDQMFASQPGLKQPITVYRGVNIDVVEHLAKGNVFHDKGFLSTTSDAKQAEQYPLDFLGRHNNAVLEIKLPAGSKAISIAETLKRPQEKEILLPRNSNFKVTGVNGNKISMELLPEPAMVGAHRLNQGDVIQFEGREWTLLSKPAIRDNQAVMTLEDNTGRVQVVFEELGTKYPLLSSAAGPAAESAASPVRQFATASAMEPGDVIKPEPGKDWLFQVTALPERGTGDKAGTVLLRMREFNGGRATGEEIKIRFPENKNLPLVMLAEEAPPVYIAPLNVRPHSLPPLPERPPETPEIAAARATRDAKIAEAIIQYNEALTPYVAAREEAITNARIRWQQAKEPLLRRRDNAAADVKRLAQQQQVVQGELRNMEKQLVDARKLLNPQLPSHAAIIGRYEKETQAALEKFIELVKALQDARVARDGMQAEVHRGLVALQDERIDAETTAHEIFNREQNRLALARDALIRQAREVGRQLGVMDTAVTEAPGYRQVAASLVAGKSSGVASYISPEMGAIGDTRIVTFADGTRAVTKRWNPEDMPEIEANTEHLGSLVGRVIMGDAMPVVLQDTPTSLLMQFVDGNVAADLPSEEVHALLTSETGKLGAFLDAIIANDDRNYGNFMRWPDGRLAPIDHGIIFSEKVERDNPIIKANGGVPIFRQEQYNEWRQQLMLLETEFTIREMDQEFKDMMRRFEYYAHQSSV